MFSPDFLSQLKVEVFLSRRRRVTIVLIWQEKIISNLL